MAAVAMHLQLPPRITSIISASNFMWPHVLQRHAPSLQRLTVLSVPGEISFATFSALCACLSLTHLEMGCVQPPSDDSAGNVLSFPPALQQLSFTGLHADDLIKFSWIMQVSAS